MKTKSKICFIMLIIGVLLIIVGAFLKIDGFSYASLVLVSGLFLELISIIGLIVVNKTKLKELFS